MTPRYMPRPSTEDITAKFVTGRDSLGGAFGPLSDPGLPNAPVGEQYIRRKSRPD